MKNVGGAILRGKLLVCLLAIAYVCDCQSLTMQRGMGWYSTGETNAVGRTHTGPSHALPHLTWDHPRSHLPLAQVDLTAPAPVCCLAVHSPERDGQLLPTHRTLHLPSQVFLPLMPDRAPPVGVSQGNERCLTV